MHAHTPTHIHLYTHRYSRVCTVIAKSFNGTLQPKKHLIFVLFLWGHQHTTQSGSRPSKSFPSDKERKKHTANWAKQSNKKRASLDEILVWEYSRIEKVSMNIFKLFIDCNPLKTECIIKIYERIDNFIQGII